VNIMIAATPKHISTTNALDSLLRVRGLLRAVGALSPAVKLELDTLADEIDQPAPGSWEAGELYEERMQVLRAKYRQ
jgi:hypothetical protein